MGRIKKKDPRAKKYQIPNPNDLESAISCIKARQMTYREASEVYGIHYSVLFRHVKNSNMKAQGGQTALSTEEENHIVSCLSLCAEWGYPLDRYDIRMVVKGYLDRRGKKVRQFNKNNLPGKDWANGFLTRHKTKLALRLCQNIKRSRAAITRETLNDYFDNLEISIDGIPPSHIVNYDETNLTDDPGTRKVITKRGSKYPERVMNNSKASTSVMFAAAADGVLLPPYVVYRSKHISDTWRIGGPKHTRFNRTKSGWFDSFCFDDWIKTIAIPYLSKLSGTKILIGDNLSSHLSTESIKICQKYNIKFVFLPTNSTHLTQPLDVAFFRPLKMHWRSILENWKKTDGAHEICIPKDHFPMLLKRLVLKLNENSVNNIKAGFEKCGIVPFNRDRVLSMSPYDSCDVNQSGDSINSSVLEFLKSMRSSNSTPRKTKKRLQVEPGKSVETVSDTDSDSELITELPHESSSDADEPEMSISNVLHTTSEPQVVKHGITFKNVIPIYKENEVNVDDWVLVSFQLDNLKQSSSKDMVYMYYIGQIIKQLDGSTFEGTFLRSKTTKLFKGFVYGFPNVKDICEFDRSQIIGKMQKPVPYCRGLFKFNFNCNSI
ncbi:uncharacterized protein LOC112681370 [Sipha flava]|uniref:Uncharacterized protein LOC112681370 n=1 Tax=Sipha flava TaxID=143950 RepID=A0A8B8F9W9_9HEMI|nr:uncharacterized protein LOC112681370 [Sipha flava]XP_025407416.1 uncharacterized protein LOC112681370 [Sipha flava]